MIRSAKIAMFSEVQRLFSIRKAADSVVKVHTIRFVGLAFFCRPVGASGLAHRGK